MIQDKKQRCIAKIISVDAYKFEAKLLEHIKSFNISGFDDIYQFIRLNGYVLVCVENNFIVTSISAIREKDEKPIAIDQNALNKISSSKILELFPVGVLEKNQKGGYQFTFGVSNYPLLYSDVLYIKDKELNLLFNRIPDKNDSSLEIGTWTLIDKYKIQISINNFFGLHSAILGNTGSGKSCTISAILQSVYKKQRPGSNFVFFDVNGEYRKAFEGNKNIHLQYLHFDESGKENSEDFYLPFQLLIPDEWLLLLKASEKIQAPIIRLALNLTGLMNQEKSGKTIEKRIIALLMLKTYHSETPSVTKYQRIQGLKERLGKVSENINEEMSPTYGSFVGKSSGKKSKEKDAKEKEERFIDKLEKLICGDDNTKGPNKTHEELQNAIKSLSDQINKIDNNIKINSLTDLRNGIELAICWYEAHGNQQIRDNCAPLITRLESLEREEFNFLKNKNVQNEGYVKFLLKDCNITIIDFNNIDDEVIEVVSTVLSRILFEYVKQIKGKRNSQPIHLVLDEAHRYISNNKGKNYEANRIFERIAKEARKYGLLLILSSQRPSEINETVVSQCSNFIIHRIQNPDDLQYMRSMTPFISKSILDNLPSIPTQHALIFGNAINLPVLFKVNDSNPKPDSENNQIVDNWKKKKFESHTHAV